MKKFEKCEDLKVWMMSKIKEIVGNPEYVLFSEKIEDSQTTYYFSFFTEKNEYEIAVIHYSLHSPYMGCMLHSRFLEPGEVHRRGRDLPDGNVSEETWDRIKNAIICSELVSVKNPFSKSSKQKEREVYHKFCEDFSNLEILEESEVLENSKIIDLERKILRLFLLEDCSNFRRSLDI